MVPASDSDAAVLYLTVQAEKAAPPMMKVLLIAELRCREQEDSEPITVWEQRWLLGEATDQMVKRDTLSTVLRPRVEQFFALLAQAHRAAVTSGGNREGKQPGYGAN
jgi:hypothetical protein